MDFNAGTDLFATNYLDFKTLTTTGSLTSLKNLGIKKLSKKKNLDMLTPLTFKRLERANYDSFFSSYRFKSNQSTNFNLYFRDYNRKPYWKLRESRLVSWSLASNNKINKRKYVNFANLKKVNKPALQSVLLNVSTRVCIPQTQLTIARKNMLFSAIITRETAKYMIFKTPTLFANYINWVLLDFKEHLLDNKISRWSYINFKKVLMPWLQKKKTKVTPYISQKSNNLDSFPSTFYLDAGTSSGFFFKDINLHSIPFSNSFYENFLFKLNIYRYQP